jgi:hypothetical protein
MNPIGLLLLLLAALWAALSTGLKAGEMANDRRDKILAQDSKLTLAHQRHLLGDWVGIFLITNAFQGFIGFLLFFSVRFVGVSDQNLRPVALILFDIVGGVFVGIVGISFVAGMFEFLAIRRHLAEYRNGKESTGARPAGERRPRRILRQLTGTQRIAALLSGLYLIGISAYAVTVWRLATTENVAVRSPLLYREALTREGERVPVQRGIPYMSDAYARVDDRFDWLVFGVATAGGVGAIWLLIPGTAWLVRGFRSPSPETAEPAAAPDRRRD